MSFYFKHSQNNNSLKIDQNKLRSVDNHYAPATMPTQKTSYGSCLCIDLSDFHNNPKLRNYRLHKNEFEAYDALIASVIQKYGGETCFNPDAVYGLFAESLHGQDHAQCAAQAAYELMDQLIELNVQRKMLRKIPFRLGIGLSSGVLDKDSEHRTVASCPLEAAYQVSQINRTTPIHTYFVTQKTLALLDTDTLPGSVEDLGILEMSSPKQKTHTFAIIHNDS